MHSSSLKLSLSRRNLTFFTKVALENVRLLLPAVKPESSAFPSPCPETSQFVVRLLKQVSRLGQARSRLCIDLNHVGI